MLRQRPFLATLSLLASCLGGTATAQAPATGSTQPAPAKAEPAPMQACAEPSSCCWKSHRCDCPIVWLRPWKCEDLEMKPVDPTPSYCGLKGFFWCPPAKENGNCEKKEEATKPEEKKNGEGDKKAAEGDKKNGQADKKMGEGEKKNGEAKKEEEKPAEEPKTLAPLMQGIKCIAPCKYEWMEKKGDNVYGWVWGGFTANFDSPSDRVNFGTNYNWRSNDVRLDAVYFVYENALEHNGTANVGYRVDFYAGNQAPFMVSNGLFSDFTGFNPTSGYGVEGPASFRELNAIGIDLPQFYLNVHLPECVTKKGMDLLVGKFWTLLGHEVYPAPLTEFYSHSYEIVYATPFNHTGILTTIHATDTWDVTAGIVRGADVFEDNNNRPSYIGNFVWNSCDKRWNWTTAWITGPEQFGNNGNYRTVLTSCIIRKFGNCNEWQFVFGGNCAWEANAAPDSTTGNINDAEWYGLSSYLFYTVDPRLILGTRLEWFRDDDGVRTAVTGRPGFAGNFYEVTLGATYKMYQNLRIRPEIRFDWFNGIAADGSAARPYNDLQDKFMATAAIDLIWEF